MEDETLVLVQPVRDNSICEWLDQILNWSKILKVTGKHNVAWNRNISREKFKVKIEFTLIWLS